jgi:Fe-S cluster assembly iron-binding protein IscA
MKRMNIYISPLAALRLKAILMQEEDGENLAVRVVPRTSGCGTPSFALELTEPIPGSFTVTAEGVPFTCPPLEKGWLDGIIIDINRENGKFIVHHPHPPAESGCPFPSDRGSGSRG